MVVEYQVAMTHIRKALDLGQNDIGPRAMWQTETCSQLITMYLHKGKTFLLLEWKNYSGWELYIPTDEGNKISTAIDNLVGYLMPPEKEQWGHLKDVKLGDGRLIELENDEDTLTTRIQREVRWQLRIRGDIWESLETKLTAMLLKKRSGSNMATDALDLIQRKLIVSGQATMDPLIAEEDDD